MSHSYDPYKAAVNHVLQSDDPIAELLELGRLETCSRQRRRRIKVGSVAALLLVGVGALWLAMRDVPSPTDPETRTALEDSLWMQELGAKARHADLTPHDEARLRSFLRSDSSLLRRGAVVTLSSYGLSLDPAVLDEIAFELAETIDIPVVVASRDGGHAADALYTNNQATLRAIARAIWLHCARAHTYPRVETIERLLEHPDQQVRERACRALGEVHGYEIGDELRARLQADTQAVRRAARRLLEKGK